MTERRHGGVWWVALFWVLAYLLPLGWRPLVQPDEVRYAEIAREMLAGGNWIVPHLDGLLYFEKPPLGYWLNAASLALFGENRFGVRFASALCVGLTGLALWAFARRHCRTDRAAIGAALIFLGLPGALAVGNFAVLDGILTLWLTLAMITLFEALDATAARPAMLRYALAGLWCALGFLTKGFVALALPLLIGTAFALWQRRLGQLLRYGWFAIATAALVALPWSLAIAQRAPDFWHYFFWHEHIRRFAGTDAQHSEPFWFYLPVIVVLGFPWLLLLRGPIVALARRNRPLFRFALCWFALPLLFFSISKGKLYAYVLPCLPPLALAAGAGFDLAVERYGRRLLRGGIVAAQLVLLGLLAAAVLNRFAGVGTPLWRDDATARWLWFCLALGFWFVALAVARRAAPRWRAGLIAAGAVPMVALTPLYAPLSVTASKMPGAFLRAQTPLLSGDTVLVADASMAQAVSWFYRRDDVYLVGFGEFHYGLTQPSGAHRYVRPWKLARFVGDSDRPVAFFDKYKGSPRPDIARGADLERLEHGLMLRLYLPHKAAP